MNRLSEFFKGADTQAGSIYPNHYLLAVFPSLPAADAAKDDLNRTGHRDSEMIAATGDEVVDFAKDHAREEGLAGALATELSKAIGAGANYDEEDLAAAKAGAAFLAVYCPNDEAKSETWSGLAPKHPIAARYYSSGGIEHF